MTYSKEIKGMAFAYYSHNVPIEKIAELVAVKDKKTIYKWIKKDGWDVKVLKFRKTAEENAKNSMKETHRKILNSVLGMFGKALKDDQTAMLKKISYKDAMEAIKLQRLDMGQPTENIAITSLEKLKKEMDEAYEQARNEFKQELGNSEKPASSPEN